MVDNRKMNLKIFLSKETCFHFSRRMCEVTVWLMTYTPRLFLFVLSRGVSSKEEIFRKFTAAERKWRGYIHSTLWTRGDLRRCAYMYTRTKGAYTHSPGRSTNKYNTLAWAAIVRTHKVETREKPTVNRRFRS